MNYQEFCKTYEEDSWISNVLEEMYWIFGSLELQTPERVEVSNNNNIIKMYWYIQSNNNVTSEVKLNITGNTIAENIYYTNVVFAGTISTSCVNNMTNAQCIPSVQGQLDDIFGNGRKHVSKKCHQYVILIGNLSFN